MAEVKLDILVGVRSFEHFGQLSILLASMARLTSIALVPTAAPISSCV